MNVRDSESVAAALEYAGMTPADEQKNADLIIVNTCSVREKAENKAIGKLGMLCSPKNRHADQIIGVMGCMVQRMGEDLFSRVPGLDFAVGTQQQTLIPQIVQQIIAGKGPVLANGTGDGKRETLDGHIPGSKSSFVTILLGCDQRCTYCIVPDVRGHEYSRPVDEIEEEVASLVSRGVKEITLLGQSVMNYGRRNRVFPEDYSSPMGLSEPLPRLLERLSSIEG